MKHSALAMGPVSRTRGFSLIELMVTVTIVAILAAIAIPSYISYSRQSRRTDAKSAMLDMASLEERYLSTNSVYSTTPTDLGYPGASYPVAIGTDYSVTVTAVAPVSGTSTTAPTLASYTIVATAVGDQANDTQCATFTVTSGGLQTATNAGGADNTATCWH